MPTRSCSAFSSTFSERRSLASSAPERLVEQQHLGVEHQRPGQRDALLLPAGQLRRAPGGERRHRDQLERRTDPGAHLGLGRLRVPQAEGHVVEHRQEREQRVALEHRVDVAPVRRHRGHVGAVEQDPAGGRLLEPGYQPERGRLTAAGGPEQREELAARYRQVDVVDRGAVPEMLGQSRELDTASGHGVISVSATACARRKRASTRNPAVRPRSAWRDHTHARAGHRDLPARSARPCRRAARTA